MSLANKPLTVLKVGGSLFDWPDLAERLAGWLSEQHDSRTLIVPGGGPLAEAIRLYHRSHRLSESVSHWLAIRTMQVNAMLLEALLPGVPVVSDPNFCGSEISILDAWGFCFADEQNAEALPHTWQVTSDSIAARVANVADAHRLVLLKSVTMDPTGDWHQAGKAGLVDEQFGKVVEQGRYRVEWLNFRD